MRDLKIKPGMDTPKAKLKNSAPKDAESILKKHMDKRQKEKEPESRDPVRYATDRVEKTMRRGAAGAADTSRRMISGCGIQCPVTQSAAVPCTVGVQFLLEHHLFQFAGLWFRFPLADRVVGFDPADDFVLPESGSTGCMAANSVSALGDLCRIPESRGVAAQSITESEKSAMSPCDPSLF